MKSRSSQQGVSGMTICEIHHSRKINIDDFDYRRYQDSLDAQEYAGNGMVRAHLSRNQRRLLKKKGLLPEVR